MVELFYCNRCDSFLNNDVCCGQWPETIETVRSETVREYMCPHLFCTKRFKTEASLRNHLRKKKYGS